MTNFIKKIIAAATLGLALVTVSPAFAADCPRGALADIAQELKDAGVTITTLSETTTKAVTEHMGANPPDTEDGFSLNITSKGDMGQLVVTSKEGCITFVTPMRPAPLNLIYKTLGISEPL